MTLPDSSFLYVHGGKRLFSYKDSNGQVDRALVEGAIADIPASELPAAVKARLVTQAKAIRKRAVEAEFWSYIRLSEPYASNSALPQGVRNALPVGGQTIYRKAFNAALKQYGGDEERAARIAWAAVKNKYRKSGDKWILKESDMGTIAYSCMSEAIIPLLKALSLRVDVAKQRLTTAPTPKPIAAKETPVAETMQESYALPAEVLCEVAALQQGEERVLRGCTLITAGHNKPRTRRWPAELLESNIGVFSNALCFVDHPAPGEARSLRSLAGHTREARWDSATNSVIGDIQLLDNEPADYIVGLFSNETVRNSGAVGLSVLFEADTYEADFEEHDGRTIQVPTKLTGSPQCDFVANPTAGGRVGSLVS